jgi:hypothetical protein
VALNDITALSQGFPHYTHLLGLNSARQAIDTGSRRITVDHVEAAVSEAISGAQQTIKDAYHRATMSTRRDHLYRQVLLACALAGTDELGYFASGDVRTPLSQIMGKRYDIPAFARHLNDFCDTKRGPVLQKTGTSHRFRFRFINPLMQPFVIMEGIASGMATLSSLRAHESARP